MLAGLLAGALDLSFALVFYGHQGATPTRILRGIAAGLIGRDAALGAGSAPVLLGLGLHFSIAVCAAFVFYRASATFTLLTRRPLVSGAVFGVAVYCFMHFIVIPLSRIPFHLQSVPNAFGNCARTSSSSESSSRWASRAPAAPDSVLGSAMTG